jgi:hypothetical protein
MRVLARSQRPGAGSRRITSPPAGRRVTGTGARLFLIAAGAVIALAVPGHPLPAVNLHVAGTIVMVAGLLWLILPVSRHVSRSGGLAGLVNPSGIDDPSVHDDQTAAAIDVVNIREEESP